VFFDADGRGGKHDPVEIMKLAKHLKLTHDDFKII
jgi:hypothetical protein